MTLKPSSTDHVEEETPEPCSVESFGEYSALINLHQSEEQSLIELRKYFTGQGRWTWMKQGITLPLDQWDELISDLQDGVSEKLETDIPDLKITYPVNPTLRLTLVESNGLRAVEARIWSKRCRCYSPTREWIALPPDVWQRLVPKLRSAIALGRRYQVEDREAASSAIPV